MEGKASPAAIDAVVAEMNLSDSHGIATFDRLFHAAPQVPILVISASGDEEVARLAVKRGAQDYLPERHLDGCLLTKTGGHHDRTGGIAEACITKRSWPRSRSIQLAMR